jgi:hypothetical protein
LENSGRALLLRSGQVSQVEKELRSLGGLRARSTRSPTIAAISFRRGPASSHCDC